MPLDILTAEDFKPKPQETARAQFARKAALTSELFDRLTEAAKRRAFRISGVNNARLIQAVRNRIAKSIEDGTASN